MLSVYRAIHVEGFTTYSCLVFPRRVVFSFWEVTKRGKISQ